MLSSVLLSDFNFEVSLVNALLLGSLSSGTSYALSMVFGDQGIQIAQNMRIGNEDHEG